MNRAMYQAGQSNGFAVSRDLNPKLVRIDTLKPLGRQTRKHPPTQIRKLGESLEQFGFVLPLVIDADARVVASWGLVLAARKIDLSEVPAVIIDDLDEAKLRLLRLALNRLGEDRPRNHSACSGKQRRRPSQLVFAPLIAGNAVWEGGQSVRLFRGRKSAHPATAGESPRSGGVLRDGSALGESFRTDDRGPPSPLECRLRMGLLRHAQTTCCYSDKAPAGDFDLAQTHTPIFMAQSSFR